MKRVRRMTAGRGSVSFSERTTRSESASTISAFPSMTSRRARRSGTIVSGSNEAFSARQPTIKHSSWANPPKYTTGTTPTSYVGRLYTDDLWLVLVTGLQLQKKTTSRQPAAHGPHARDGADFV